MSIVTCDKCSRRIDSDFDLECFTPDEQTLCEGCRDKREAEQMEAMLDARSEYNAAPLSETDPEQYRQNMIDAGRGHLLTEKERSL